MKINPIVIVLLVVVFGQCVAVAAEHPLNSLGIGHWYEVPNTKLEVVNPCPQVSCPPGDINSVMKSWSGGSYDKDNQQLLVWGGGHANYAGNELYAFDVRNNTWKRITDPSVNVGGTPSTFVYPDGLPRSFHTHNYIEYVPPKHAFVSFGGVAPYPDPGVTSRVFAYSCDTGRWIDNLFPNVPSGGVARYSNAVYDQPSNSIWYQSGEKAQLHRLGLDTEKWSSHAKMDGWFSSYTVAAIDPDRRLFVHVGGGKVVVWDLNNPDNPPTLPQTGGNKFVQNGKAPGFVFDPNIKKFVGWAGGSEIYTLNPEDWTWEKISAAEGNSITPCSPALNGTFGRFQYMPEWNAYILVNATDENVYYYRLGEVVVRAEAPPNFREQ